MCMGWPHSSRAASAVLPTTLPPPPPPPPPPGPAGRVKTLHPGVHGGILARRDLPAHMEAISQHNITPIDLVIVNLYPFRQTVTAAAKPSYEVRRCGRWWSGRAPARRELQGGLPACRAAGAVPSSACAYVCVPGGAAVRRVLLAVGHAPPRSHHPTTNRWLSRTSTSAAPP